MTHSLKANPARRGFGKLLLSLKTCLIILVLFGSLGCARSPDDSFSSVALTGDLAFPVQVLTDNFVRRQPPAVYVQPRAPIGHRPRALFVPLRAVQQIGDPVTFSDLLSRQIWQVWLGQGAFETLEYAPQAGPFDRNRALAYARQKGAEVLVGGVINHFIDGGDNGTSDVSLGIELYDVKTGNMIYSMAQGGLMDPAKKHDFYLFTITERNPADPTGLITRSLAWDMGNVVKKWVNPYAGDDKSSIWDDITGNKAF